LEKTILFLHKKKHSVGKSNTVKRAPFEKKGYGEGNCSFLLGKRPSPGKSRKTTDSPGISEKALWKRNFLLSNLRGEAGTHAPMPPAHPGKGPQGEDRPFTSLKKKSFG